MTRPPPVRVHRCPIGLQRLPDPPVAPKPNPAVVKPQPCRPSHREVRPPAPNWQTTSWSAALRGARGGERRSATSRRSIDSDNEAPIVASCLIPSSPGGSHSLPERSGPPPSSKSHVSQLPVRPQNDQQPLLCAIRRSIGEKYFLSGGKRRECTPAQIAPPRRAVGHR